MKFKKIHLSWVFTFVLTYIIIALLGEYKQFFGILKKLWVILSPFFIGLILAYMLAPIVNFLERKFKMKRWMSLLIVYGGIILLTVGFFIWIIPLLVNSIVDLVGNIPVYAEEVEKWISLKDMRIDPAIVDTVKDKLVTFIPKVSNILVWSLNNLLNTTISIANLIFNIIFAFIISVYMLADKENFTLYVKKVCIVFFKEKHSERIFRVVRLMDENVGTFIVAKSIDSFFVGVVSYVGLLLLGSKYALLLGIFCGITNMIPYFGPFLGMIPVAVINIFYSTPVTIACLVFLLIVQQIEGNIIEPKFVGGKLGLNALLTLIAVAIGGGFFGIMGMILSVPIMGVIKIYFDALINRHYKKKEIEIESTNS